MLTIIARVHYINAIMMLIKLFLVQKLWRLNSLRHTVSYSLTLRIFLFFQRITYHSVGAVGFKIKQSEILQLFEQVLQARLLQRNNHWFKIQRNSIDIFGTFEKYILCQRINQIKRKHNKDTENDKDKNINISCSKYE